MCSRGGLFEAGCVVEVRCAFKSDGVKWAVQSMCGQDGMCGLGVIEAGRIAEGLCGRGRLCGRVG